MIVMLHYYLNITYFFIQLLVAINSSVILTVKDQCFPPYDLRITGRVNYDDMITKGEFWEIVKQTLEKT